MTANPSFFARSDTATRNRPERAIVAATAFPFLTGAIPTARLKLRPLQAEDAPRVAMFVATIGWWSFMAAWLFMVAIVLSANWSVYAGRDAFEPLARVYRSGPRAAVHPA